MLYHRGWCQAVEMAASGLNASLLIVHPADSNKYIVNIDPQVIELIQEAKYLHKMNLEVRGSAVELLNREEEIKKTREVYANWMLRIFFKNVIQYEIFAMADDAVWYRVAEVWITHLREGSL